MEILKNWPNEWHSNTVKLSAKIDNLVKYVINGTLIYALNMCRLWLILYYFRAVYIILRYCFGEKLYNLLIFCLKKHINHGNHRKSCSMPSFIPILLHFNGFWPHSPKGVYRAEKGTIYTKSVCFWDAFTLTWPKISFRTGIIDNF